MIKDNNYKTNIPLNNSKINILIKNNAKKLAKKKSSRN